MKKSKITIKVISILICLLFVFSINSSSIMADGEVVPEQPTEEQEQVIEAAADFLDDMGMGDMADNVRSWLENNKILIDVNLRANGTTNRQGIINLNSLFVQDLSDDEIGRFRQIANLAMLLLHEKTHAHQAPEGGALSPGIEEGDWTAGADVHRECIGPDPLEVEAYYKQIRAFLLWAKTIRAQEIAQGLTPEEAAAAQKTEDEKVAWLINEAKRWAGILKTHNFEKANRFVDVDYLEDLFEVIDNDSELTDAQKVQRKIDILNDLLEEIFAENSFYDRARDLYEAKQGEEESTAVVPAIPGSMETILIEFFDGMGNILIEGLPVELDTGTTELIEISVHNFMIPPEADPGYRIVSPVYEVSWNAKSPIPFNISIMIEDTGETDLLIAAFCLKRTNIERDWTPLETEVVSDGEISVLSSESDAATMFAVIAPDESYLDMPSQHWAYDATARLEDADVLEDDSMIYPVMDVTRELFVKYLVKALNLEIIEESLPFDDVDPTSPYFPYISTAYYNGLTTGVAVDRFGMGEIIPREQSITFLVRALGMEQETIAMQPSEMMGHIDSFFDIYTDCSEWAHPYLAQAVKIQMLKGYPDSTLRGKNLLNHAEVISLIDRIMVHIAYNGIQEEVTPDPS